MTWHPTGGITLMTWQVCYTPAMSNMINKHSPSLRVLFAGLAKLTFENARGSGTELKKPGKTKEVKRDGAKWLVVSGLLSFGNWRVFLDRMALIGLDLRRIPLCFLYSTMVVIDGATDDGRIKERHLPFEGFLEALVRLATVIPLPTDAMLKQDPKNAEEPGFVHAGAFMAELEASADATAQEAMIAEQACEWGDVPDPATAGEMPRRFAHLMDVN